MKEISTAVVTWVGLDAHKKFITVARLTGDAPGVRESDQIQGS